MAVDAAGRSKMTLPPRAFVSVAPEALHRHTRGMHSISFQPVYGDLLAASRLHFRTSLRTKRTLRSYLLGCVLFAIMGLALAWREAPFVQMVAVGGELLLWSGIMCLIMLTNYLLLPRRVRRTFTQQKALHDHFQAEWSDAGISFRSTRGFCDLKWTDFVGLKESRQAILLLQSDNLYNFIPKRVLSAEQAASIMSHAA